MNGGERGGAVHDSLETLFCDTVKVVFWINRTELEPVRVVQRVCMRWSLLMKMLNTAMFFEVPLSFLTPMKNDDMSDSLLQVRRSCWLCAWVGTEQSSIVVPTRKEP